MSTEEPVYDLGIEMPEDYLALGNTSSFAGLSRDGGIALMAGIGVGMVLFVLIPGADLFKIGLIPILAVGGVWLTTQREGQTSYELISDRVGFWLRRWGAAAGYSLSALYPPPPPPTVPHSGYDATGRPLYVVPAPVYDEES